MKENPCLHHLENQSSCQSQASATSLLNVSCHNIKSNFHLCDIQTLLVFLSFWQRTTRWRGKTSSCPVASRILAFQKLQSLSGSSKSELALFLPLTLFQQKWRRAGGDLWSFGALLSWTEAGSKLLLCCAELPWNRGARHLTTGSHRWFEDSKDPTLHFASVPPVMLISLPKRTTLTGDESIHLQCQVFFHILN